MAFFGYGPLLVFMAFKVCPDCGVRFSYEPNPNFPDKRKYCDKCGAVRKASYEASKVIPQGFSPVPSINGQTINQTIVKEYKDKANSYEFGKAGQRIKLYFETLTELKALVQEAVDTQLVEDPRVIKIE